MLAKQVLKLALARVDCLIEGYPFIKESDHFTPIAALARYYFVSDEFKELSELADVHCLRSEPVSERCLRMVAIEQVVIFCRLSVVYSSGSVMLIQIVIVGNLS